MTANAKRIPDDFAGAFGVIAKPYSERVVASTLAYLAGCRAGGPTRPAPTASTRRRPARPRPEGRLRPAHPPIPPLCALPGAAPG